MPREYQNLKIQLIPTAAANVLIEEGFEKLGYSQDMLSSVGLFLLASCSGLLLPKEPAVRFSRLQC